MRMRRMGASLGRVLRAGRHSVLAVQLAQGCACNGPDGEQHEKRSPCAPCQYVSPCRHVGLLFDVEVRPAHLSTDRPNDGQVVKASLRGRPFGRLIFIK
ncbi:MAG: hypothetical protein HYX43_04185 [Burkholderiales bacterium]|nr:hypothetical protein [Burkholderiales bacterium]